MTVVSRRDHATPVAFLLTFDHRWESEQQFILPLRAGRNLIGRSPNCDHMLEVCTETVRTAWDMVFDPPIVLPLQILEWLQCVIEITEFGVQVQDHWSSAGTIIVRREVAYSDKVGGDLRTSRDGTRDDLHTQICEGDVVVCQYSSLILCGLQPGD